MRPDFLRTCIPQLDVRLDLLIAHACVRVFGNLANGLGESVLTMGELDPGNVASRAQLNREPERVVPELI